MASDLFCALTDGIEVVLESVKDSPFSLANILFLASVASNAVYHIV